MMKLDVLKVLSLITVVLAVIVKVTGDTNGAIFLMLLAFYWLEAGK